MTIGQLSNISGISAKTIRYYESIKLIARPKTTQSGYRIYNSEYAERLNLIKNAKVLGFTLNEIKSILSMDDCRDVCNAASVKLNDTVSKIAELKSLEKKLRLLIRKCSNRGSVTNCSVIKSISPKTERRSV